MRLLKSLVTLFLSLSAAASALQERSLQERALQVAEGSVSEVAARSTVDDIWDAIVNAADCTACQAVLVLLKGVALLGDKAFVSIVSEVCQLSGAEDDDVCAGSIALEGPIIAHDLREMTIGSKTAQLFCITFLGLCPYPDVTPNTITFPTTKPSTGRPAPSGQEPIKVVHYSDIHIDPFYVAGSNTNCTKPICCRDYSAEDSPGQTDAPAGPNGDHNCDVPVSLEESMYAAIKSIVPDAAFTIFTGDIVDHAVWNTTQAQNTLDINDAYNRMAAAGLNLVYGTAGNHEMSPTNAFPPTAVGNQAQWVYNLLSAAWQRWLGVADAAEAESFGTYSVKYADGNLKVISLSTNMYYVQNYWLYEKTMEKDPSGQFAWLVSELDASEQSGERVYIIGHMPMGTSDAFHDGSNYFDQIVSRYSSTISAMFFGHTHVDHFEIHYSSYTNRNYSNALVTSYIAPSLTPTSGHPAFRVYDVDPVTFAVLDSVTYIADMTNPSYQTTGPVWTKYYSAKEAYGPLVSPPVTEPSAELSPAFWHNVTLALAADQSAFDAYYARKSRGWDVASCTGECAVLEICELQSGRAQDNCVTPTPGVHFSKRGEEAGAAAGHADECGVSVARSALASLAARKSMLELLERRLVEKRALLEAGNE